MTAKTIRCVALFRGINVGRAKRVAMADLRELLKGLGFTEVATILNSGNAVFTATKADQKRHARLIQEAVARDLGVEAAVMVKSAQEIAAAVANNPLVDLADNPSRLLVVFTAETATLESLAPLVATDWAPEALQAGPQAAYLWCPAGVLESKAAVAVNKQLGSLATTRNWSTVLKIHALLG